jgi:DNA-binding transcriptional MerR regulator
MKELIKIREVSLKYGITTRTLRYYEDVGLIKSTKTDDYSYRCYDDKNLIRLEQILILRKLNISIKDIKKIFTSRGSGTILEVLRYKANDIDKEAALLYELKVIVLEFIRQIEKANFRKKDDVKLLYKKASEIEKRLNSIEKDDHAASIKKLIDISDEIEKEPEVRIIELPAMKMIFSPHGDPEQPKGEFQEFNTWARRELFNNKKGHPNSYSDDLPLFAWNDPKGFRFLIKKPVDLKKAHKWEEYAFPGGLYAVFAAWLPEMMEKYRQVVKWVEKSNIYQLDKKAEQEGRYVMGHIITPPELMKKIKNEQQDVFVPIIYKGGEVLS